MIKMDANLPPVALKDAVDIGRAAEALGFAGIWSSETQHDPFLPLALIANETQNLEVGTAVAIAFARSPATLSYTAWDLAASSAGRFTLGLGTQVRAHIERRFGMSWPESPIGRLREMIAAVRAFWQAWQSGERLNFRGEHYKLTLMSPFFNPGPIASPDIPIYLAGVNPGMISLCGEVANGLHAHPLHSERYLREVIHPALQEGAVRGGRNPEEIQLSVSVFMVTNDKEADFVRSQIAFYASTPSYRRVLELHGWERRAEELSELARRQEWGAMSALIDDEMLETFAVVAPAEAMGSAVLDRYVGLVDRVTPYLPLRPGERDPFWSRLINEVHGA
ncbi:MAG: TIGR03617 family F420-dependent LLM class oxidoreductase [Anaerolineales bacterium]|jgi:probable F420-dependent oxidoreductase